MRTLVLVALSFSLVVSACSKSSGTDSSSSDKGAAKPTEGSKDDKKGGGGSGGGGNGGGPATDDKGGVAVPSDPLTDYPTVYASCDSVKDTGECVEYAEVGFTEDSVKSLCDGMPGKWVKGKNCPKEGKIAACNVAEGKNRHVYYKPYFAAMKPEDAKTLCSGVLLGTWGEFPKGK